MSDSQIKFNSKYGFDLNSIQSISITGTKTLQDKILILRKNPISQNYYLEPQDIGIQHGINDTTLTLKDNDNNYTKSLVFLNNSETVEKTIYELPIDITSVSTQGLISINLKLMARETLADGSFHNHVFEIGDIIPHKIRGQQQINRNVKNGLLILFNNNDFRLVNSQVYSSYENASSTISTPINPIFSTMASIGQDLKIQNLPYLVITETTDNDFVITINVKPISINTRKIEWFGNLEITISVT